MGTDGWTDQWIEPCRDSISAGEGERERGWYNIHHPLIAFVVVVVVPSKVMSGGFGNAMGRVVTQLVDRFVTEKLANNHTFQQAAVKTARKVADIKKAKAEGNIKIKPELGNNSLFNSIRDVKNGLTKEINEEIAKANAKLAKK